MDSRGEAESEQIWEGIEQGVFQTFSSDLPVLFRGRARQAESQGANLVPLGAERHPRHRDAASDSVEQGRRRGPRYGQRVRGADLDQPCQNVRPLSEEGRDRGRIRCDIVLWDANRKEVIQQDILHHGADYMPYEGLAATGWPVMTILRGKVVAEEGRILGEPGDGSFLRRGLSPYAAPSRAAWHRHLK
jgi:dihydropyrimidinase